MQKYIMGVPSHTADSHAEKTELDMTLPYAVDCEVPPPQHTSGIYLSVHGPQVALISRPRGAAESPHDPLPQGVGFRLRPQWPLK